MIVCADICRLLAYRTYIAHGLQPRRLLTAYPLVRSRFVLVGDTGFEPVTSSVSALSGLFPGFSTVPNFLLLQRNRGQGAIRNHAEARLNGCTAGSSRDRADSDSRA